MSSPKDKSAEIARNQERKRQQKITYGTKLINRNFEGFDDPFFSDISQRFLDFYQPQIAEQFGRARKGMTFDLARNRNLDSSAAAGLFSDLLEARDKNTARTADQALGAENAARANVARDRSDLVAQLSATADPSAAAASSAARALDLSRPGDLSPMGDIFAGFGNIVGGKIVADRLGVNGPNSLFAVPNRQRIIS